MRLPLLVTLLASLPLCSCVAWLPSETQVQPGPPLPIDGVWRMQEAPERDWQPEPPTPAFRIDRGRIMAAELFTDTGWRIDPGMVVVSQLRQLDARRFEGVEPLGRYLAELQPDGTLRVSRLLPTAVIELTLVPERLANRGWFDAQLASTDVVSTVGLIRPLAPASSVAPADPVRRVAAPLPPATPIGGTGFGRYFALVIGNDGYDELPELRTARSDARAVAQVLRDRYAFEVEVLEDATRQDILLGLRGMRERLGPEDNLLVYYAGHGWLDEEADEGYWLPVDASRDNEINWIANSAITAYFKAIQAKHILVVADSCYAGKLTRGIRIQTPTPNAYEELARKRARVVLTSGGLEPVADAGGGNHSPFARAFVDALASNERILDTTTLFGEIRRPVMLASDQTPELSDIRKAGHDGGDFLFVPKR